MKKCMLLIPRMGNGGAERVMATIANNLCKKFDVCIVTLTDSKSFYNLNENVDIIGLSQSINRKNKCTYIMTAIVGGINSFLKLIQIIKYWKPDVILSFLQATNAIAIFLKLLGVKSRLVVSERCDPTVRNFMNRWFEYHFYKYADAVVCQSSNVANFFDVATQKKISIIPNMISANAIPPRFEGERRKCVVGIGRLDNQKNFTMLINAFANLPQTFSDYTLEIYGGGNQEPILKTQIAQCNMCERIFLKGVTPNVMFSVADAALYVMSSDFEGFPNALLEAMATGLPVISTDFSTGVARDLIHEENGKIIPVGDESALVEAMIELLSNSDKWDVMSCENRKLSNKFSEEKIISKWEVVLGLK